MKRYVRAMWATALLLQACSSDPVMTPPGGMKMAVAMPGAAAGGAAPGIMQPPSGVIGGPSMVGSAGGGAPSMGPGAVVPPGSPPVTEGAPAGPDPNNWFAFGGGYEQTYARVDADIEESNLAMLGAASWAGEAPMGGVTGTPAIYDGVMYWADWVGNVHAQKTTDGTEMWSPAVKFPRGFTSSPFVDKDRVYLADRDNMVRALDRLTGKELWSTAVSDNKLSQLWSSPMVADGVVVVGLGGKGTSDGGTPYSATDLMSFRGGVVGLDAAMGTIRWKFDNTKSKGMMYGPGVSSWSSPALDTTRKIAYIGAGNSYYSPASPYSDSLLALNYMTSNPEGELVWSRQFTMNDNFTSGSPMGPDSDVGATPNLFSLDGKDFVAVGDKGGGFYVMEREKGELVFPRVRVSAGSSTGGVMAPAAYNDGKLYITTNNSGSTVVLALDARTGAVDWQVSDSSGVTYGAPLLLKDVLLIGTTSGFATGARGGELHAYRVADGTRVMGWALPLKNQRGGGISVYRNTLFVPYGYVFENNAAERTLTGGVLVAALGGKPVEGGPVAAPATFAPTFSAVYGELLNELGCSAGFCHGGTGLQLEDPMMAYTNLVSAVSNGAGCENKKFIVPNDVANSYLYTKLLPNPPCGKQMPADMTPLTDQQLAQIRTWIEMGAPNN